MNKYNHAIDVAFEFVSEDEDPITLKNLEALVAKAREKLDSILEDRQLDAFDAYDSFIIEE
tara:strand:+ start:2915 stop:3097 length:183 start_codon:yes stop_codon:yes gene_type:complete